MRASGLGITEMPISQGPLSEDGMLIFVGESFKIVSFLVKVSS